MPPKITRVRWSARNIPWGIIFDENTGVFSGKPEDIGEYTVPVTVETNYGKDTKNVKIVVTSSMPTYDLCAIGSRAEQWSEHNSPDENGFYKLNLPKMQKLVAHYNGFGALTVDYKYYFCGGYGQYRTASGALEKTSYLAEWNIPRCLTEIYSDVTEEYKEIFSGVDKTVTLFYYKKGTEGSYNVTESGYVIIFWNSKLAKYIAYPAYLYRIKTHKKYTSDTTRTYIQMPTSIYRITGVSPENGATVFDESSYSTCSDSVHYLTDENRGKIKKIFQYTNCFEYLSVDGYLDGNPDNFTHGTIKDAWVCNNTACVQTIDNQLYEYTSKTKEWLLLGAYDMKKIELTPEGRIFILTEDGKLCYKGSAIKGLIDTAHETLTQLFPALTFMDFTYSGGDAKTLVVLRE